jgi:hypothetical protein
VTDPNLPDQPGAPVPPASQPVPPAPQPAPAYGAPGTAPAYGQTAPAYGQPAGAKTNTLAIISLVASLIGIFSGIGFIAGIICGHISLSQIKKTGEEGRGMAIAGLIIGYVGVLLSIIVGIILAVLFAGIAASGGFTTTY